MNQQNMQQMDPITLMKNSKSEVCSNCEGTFFRQVFMVRRLSGILTGGHKDQLIPFPILRCDDCGQVIEDMIPSYQDNKKQENQEVESNIIITNPDAEA